MLKRYIYVRNYNIKHRIFQVLYNTDYVGKEKLRQTLIFEDVFYPRSVTPIKYLLAPNQNIFPPKSLAPTPGYFCCNFNLLNNNLRVRGKK